MWFEDRLRHVFDLRIKTEPKLVNIRFFFLKGSFAKMQMKHFVLPIFQGFRNVHAYQTTLRLL